MGVYAIRDIPAGINPFLGAVIPGSELFMKDELVGLPEEVQTMIRDFFVTDAGGHIDIPDYGLNGMDISYFVNHSKTPNMVTHDESETFVTAREIKTGEELTVDYSSYDARPQ